jgi:hypothetical protein
MTYVSFHQVRRQLDIFGGHATLAALFLVLVLRMAAGPIEVKMGGLEFKGAAAPIVFWLICFLAIAISIKSLWIPNEIFKSEPSCRAQNAIS